MPDAVVLRPPSGGDDRPALAPSAPLGEAPAPAPLDALSALPAVREGAPVASTPARVLAGRALTAVAVVAVAVAAWRLRGTLGDAVAALTSLGTVALVAVGACWLAMVVARAAVYRWSHPRSTLGQGLVLDHVNLASTNALPAGMVVGWAARYRVGRSFGQTPDGAALTMVAASQAFSLGRWLLVVVVIGRTVLVGHGTDVDGLVLASALGAVLVAAVLGLVAVRDDRFTRALVAAAQRGLDRVGRRFGRARDVPLVPFVDGLRLGVRDLLCRRGWWLLLGGAFAGLAGAAIVVVVVHGVDGAAAPGVWDLLRAYLLARVATSFVPTPGNVGALEGAMTASLVAAGATAPAAVGAVLVYRCLTYALPIATGSVAYLGWRRWERSRAV